MSALLSSVFLSAPIAHRAYHNVSDGRPENSLAAIDAAIANGYGIEIDVQLTRDDRAVVFHDYDLRRVTKVAGEVRSSTATELAQIHLNGGGTIPSLEAVLSHVDGRAPLLIELKDQDGQLGRETGVLEAAVATDLEDYEGPVALMSFNPHTVRELVRQMPQRAVGMTTSAWTEEDWPHLPEELREHLQGIPDFESSGASFISHDASDLGRDRVAELKAQGVPILCWTIRSEADELKAREVADNVTFEGYAAKHPTG